MLLLLLALQATSPAPASPERFSILVPVADQRCTRARADGEVVVCADAPRDQSLPLPAEAAPIGPIAVNPDLTGSGALRSEGSPCAAMQKGCTTGVNLLGLGTALVRGVQKLVAPGSCCEDAGAATNPGLLVRDIAGAFRGKKPQRDAVGIDLDEPDMKGRVRP
ncbi:hypothetical protein K7957_13240 [Sphingomonas yunnanensis]|uniref:hypothetical protein n=1 Tax=Sphingomonas yunnanensis TaxID=310400 RepID=UPI001CA71663|nr:hypothetical protein [Sphingomonas yunnanensis]MBY9063902.1 hypothetical protein [Sphingomonas yunnanensis]